MKTTPLARRENVSFTLFPDNQPHVTIENVDIEAENTGALKTVFMDGEVYNVQSLSQIRATPWPKEENPWDDISYMGEGLGA